MPTIVEPANLTLNGGGLQITAGTPFNTSTINTNRGITWVSGGTINVLNVTSGTFSSNEAAVQYRGVISRFRRPDRHSGTGANTGSNPRIFSSWGQ